MVQDGGLGRPGRARDRDARRRSAAARPSGPRSSPSARSSISRIPSWTCPSSRPSSVTVNAGPRPSSSVAADVVHERRCQQQVAAQPRVQLRRLAAERRDADGVLEQAAGVRVVAVGRGRVGASSGASASTARTVAARPGCETSATRNSRKPCSSSVSRRAVGCQRRRDRRRPPRASGRRAAAGRGTARRGRARARRRPRRSGRRAARRRSRRAPRSCPSGRRARARGTRRRRLVRSFRLALTA